ncbi:hypothetical protein B0J15DRAFT_527467 [Fusarium solani]|uniref:Uncharacterized protein n=1 Tax=Fusarium solani TaxID=169388 RepID=A0A9P9GZ02_FUSSL|nr:uncharacterized protein B0J15DRAFT_527467 [Fusarium solani]KAH7248148.1 hypothetical protein B0J15DRAFT_527467 [Fusarium solani]
MSTCDCFTGTPGDRSYEPKGTVKTLHGLNVYQALAPADVKGEILFLPDVFGLATHNKILADEYAIFGYNTTIVDYFQGDALPDIIMSYTPGTDVDSYSNFSPEHSERPLVSWQSSMCWATVSEGNMLFVSRDPTGSLRQLQCTRYSDMYPAHNSHSSRRKTGRPLNDQSWFAAQMETVTSNSAIIESDVFTPTLIAETFKAAAKWKVYYKISVYGGTVHGFASRADRSNNAEMRPYRSSFEDSLSWMKLVNGS